MFGLDVLKNGMIFEGNLAEASLQVYTNKLIMEGFVKGK